MLRAPNTKVVAFIEITAHIRARYDPCARRQQLAFLYMKGYVLE